MKSKKVTVYVNGPIFLFIALVILPSILYAGVILGFGLPFDQLLRGLWSANSVRFMWATYCLLMAGKYFPEAVAEFRKALVVGLRQGMLDERLSALYLKTVNRRFWLSSAFCVVAAVVTPFPWFSGVLFSGVLDGQGIFDVIFGFSLLTAAAVIPCLGLFFGVLRARTMKDFSGYDLSEFTELA